MPRVTVRSSGHQGDPDTVFARLRDFSSYPTYTDTVIEVSSEQTGPESFRSAWSVMFRNGVLKWVEDEEMDPAARVIRFELVSGDLERFDGSWVVDDRGEVTLDVTFESGLGTLSEIVDPIAERTLEENFETILAAVLPDAGGES